MRVQCESGEKGRAAQGAVRYICTLFHFCVYVSGDMETKATPAKEGTGGGTGKAINSQPLLSLQHLLALLVGDHGCNKGLPSSHTQHAENMSVFGSQNTAPNIHKHKHEAILFDNE